MDKISKKILKEYFYAFNTPSGILILYGDNMDKCKPYITDAVDSVEDVCEYCKAHGLSVFYKAKKTLAGLLGLIRTYRLTKIYSVYSSWKNVCEYIVNHSVIE